VRIRVGSGIYVSEPPGVAEVARTEGEGPFELLRARSFIEGAVAAEAAARIEPQHLAILDDLLARMEEAVQPSDEAIRLDRAFHVAVASVLGNAVIERCVRDLFDQRMSPYFGRLAAHFENEASWKEALREHRAIRNALAERDSILARDALRRHLERSQARFSMSFGDLDGEADEREVFTERLSRAAIGRA
jgi:DNA-binding GntR family transcriptional regulator